MHVYSSMTVSTENATTLKSTKSRNSNSSVPIQIKPKSQFEFVPQDTEKSEFLDLVDFGCVAILVEKIIHVDAYMYQCIGYSLTLRAYVYVCLCVKM